MIVVTCGNSFLTNSTNESIDFFPLPLIFTVSILGHTLINAARAVFPITPGPTMATVFESFLARYFAPTPGIAPVLYALKRFADISANGAPVSLSLSIIIRIERGSPSFLFSIFEPYHFIPAIWKFPPRYAGIAINLLSSPFFGIPSNSGLSGNVTIQPCEL